MRHITRHNLWDSATAVASTGAITSDPIKLSPFAGSPFAIRIVKVAGTTLSINVTITVSDTKKGSYVIPLDVDGTSLGNIVAAGSEIDASSWIQFDAPIATYMKITITGSATNSANCTVKAHLIAQDD